MLSKITKEFNFSVNFSEFLLFLMMLNSKFSWTLLLWFISLSLALSSFFFFSSLHHHIFIQQQWHIHFFYLLIYNFVYWLSFVLFFLFCFYSFQCLFIIFIYICQISYWCSWFCYYVKFISLCYKIASTAECKKTVTDYIFYILDIIIVSSISKHLFIICFIYEF